jgi:uncharacterized sporulation protein YeaH/YhbH (DUF444 family)
VSFLIDRRLNGKNKSMVNRQRFLDRYRQHIKKAVTDAISRRSITDIVQGEKISIPSKDVGEPIFGHGTGGKRSIIHPGNKEFVAGDRIARPSGGAGGGSGSGASNSGEEGSDEFAFHISHEEFLDFMFEDLELPNLVRRQLAGIESFKMRRAGIGHVGTPNQINIVRSLKAAQGRRLALGGPKRREIKILEAELNALLAQPDSQPNEQQQDADRRNFLEQQLAKLRHKLEHIPYIDDFDIRYNLSVKEPIPSSKAVMFCIMDVSGSMTQETKDIAKRFFILLYLFLQRNYEHIEVVFIRHHTSAKEVDEQEFFYSRETGGTIVSSALKLMQEIIAARFPTSQWNIYGAQASDGDNWNDDSSQCYDVLTHHLLPQVQHFSYVEITPRDHQALWHEYHRVLAEHPDSFAMQQIIEAKDIYPVFRELFQRRSV